MSYNKIILAGNLTRDVEIKYTQGGSAIGNTAIATTRKFKSQSGEQKEEVLFVDITFFGRSAEIANQYLGKGSKILVDGRLKLDQWTSQDGTKRSKHSVNVENMQMLDSKQDATENMQKQNAQTQQAPSHNAPTQGHYSQPHQASTQNRENESSQNPSIPEIDIAEPDIPFAPLGMSEGGYYVHLV